MSKQREMTSKRESLDQIEDTVSTLQMAVSNLQLCCHEISDHTYNDGITRDALCFVAKCIEELAERLDTQLWNYMRGHSEKERKFDE